MAQKPQAYLLKQELTSAALRGIAELLGTTRGAAMFGAKARAVLVDNRTVRVYATNAANHTFELLVKEVL